MIIARKSGSHKPPMIRLTPPPVASPESATPPGAKPLTPNPIHVSPRVLEWISNFGTPLIAAIPAVTPDGDHSEDFAHLLARVDGAPVVLFPDISPSALDGFFRLRLTQVLDDRAPLPALSVIVLSSEVTGPALAGGFANRFRSGWPFARCIFVTEHGDPAVLSALIGLPVARLNGGTPPPETLHTNAAAGQKVALVLHQAWNRCGSTTAFENQVEDLVAAGFFTIRLFADGHARRGATFDSGFASTIAENGTNAGAHLNTVAVPDGPHAPDLASDPVARWATSLAANASCRVRDTAITLAAAIADSVIVNHIDYVGTAIVLAPQARLMVVTHDDRAAAERAWMLGQGYTEAETQLPEAAAARVQGHVLAIPDIAVHVSITEAMRLGPHCRRNALILPRIYARTVTNPEPPRFDLLLVGDQHPFNIASFRWFLQDVWRPYLQPAMVRTVIVGRAGKHVSAPEYESPLLHFMGFAEDLEALRSCCAITVVPDRAGTGVSVKMLNTLAVGHPVASTSLGLRGIDPAVTVSLPVHDDARALAEDILSLVRSPERREERRQQVRQLHEAIRQESDYAALIQSVARPTPGIQSERAVQWASIVAAAHRPDARPHYFTLDSAFEMSGCAWDSQVLLDGWHGPEPWGRWTDGAAGCLRVTFAEPADEPLSLELDVVPAPGGASLSISVDGTMLPAIDPRPGANAWPIPLHLTIGKASFLVCLHAGATFSPSAIGGSADYRILGIGVAAVRLRSRQQTLYEAGRFMPIRAGAMPGQVLLDGWHEPESWGCWSSTKTAMLQLATREPLQGPIFLELDLAPPPIRAMLGISVNDHSMAMIAPLDGINRWLLPAEITAGRTLFQVALSVSNTFCPARDGGSADERTLGIGLRGIRLTAVV
jgi:Glycosyl transferases group 1